MAGLPQGLIRREMALLLFHPTHPEKIDGPHSLRERKLQAKFVE